MSNPKPQQTHTKTHTHKNEVLNLNPHRMFVRSNNINNNLLLNTNQTITKQNLIKAIWF